MVPLTLRTLALVLLAVASCAADLGAIKSRGVLRVIAQRDEAPEMFRFKGDGQPGFEREMVEGFARLHDVRVEPVQVPTSAERIQALLRDEGDVVIGLVDTEARRRLIAFTDEVLPARHLVVTYKPHRVVGSVEEFRAEKVGVVKGTSWAQAAAEAGVPTGETEMFTDRRVMLDALRDGKIGATVMTTTDFLLATRPYPGLQGGVYLGEAGKAGWGVRKDDTELLAALDAYLGNFRAGPSWSRLVVKYFGEQSLAALGRTRR
jgi:ABC-type amino acid transport substrate-binding protein